MNVHAIKQDHAFDIDNFDGLYRTDGSLSRRDRDCIENYVREAVRMIDLAVLPGADHPILIRQIEKKEKT